MSVTKDQIDAAVKTLLSLKNDYKTKTGKEWKPDSGKPVGDAAKAPAVPASKETSKLSELNDSIVSQGNKVRDLKSAKAAKVIITFQKKFSANHLFC